MDILVVGNEAQKKEFLSCVDNNNYFIFAQHLPAESEHKNYDAFFIFSNINSPINFDLFKNKPVFINEVIQTSAELNYPPNVVRINGWPGFIQRTTWEIVSQKRDMVENVSKFIGRKLLAVKDEPGLVAARVISMVINEAFFAMEEKISTRQEIDMAMKLGTNYPFGPLEWAEKIGIENIYNLLEMLAKKDARYIPANQLKKEFLNTRKI